MTGKRIKIVCDECGSDDVRRDAYAECGASRAALTTS
jgi:hypothetical protein